MAEETKEKILSAALELFSARGYDGVGTKTIAQAAGVNEVTLFRTFGTKEALWLAVFHRYLVRPEPELLLAEVDGRLDHDLRAICRAIVSLLKSNTKLVRMGVIDLRQVPSADAELRAQPIRMEALLTDHLSRWAGELTVPPEKLAKVLVTTLFGAVLHLDLNGNQPYPGGTEQWLEDTLDLMLHGILSSTNQTKGEPR